MKLGTSDALGQEQCHKVCHEQDTEDNPMGGDSQWSHEAGKSKSENSAKMSPPAHLNWVMVGWLGEEKHALVTRESQNRPSIPLTTQSLHQRVFTLSLPWVHTSHLLGSSALELSPFSPLISDFPCSLQVFQKDANTPSQCPPPPKKQIQSNTFLDPISLPVLGPLLFTENTHKCTGCASSFLNLPPLWDVQGLP